MNSIKSILLTLFTLLALIPAKAQQIEVGMLFGTSQYLGDLSDEKINFSNTYFANNIILDIVPGSSGSSPSQITRVNDGTNDIVYVVPLGTDQELWRTDGTAAGTAMVKDIHAGPAGANPNSAVMAGGVLYFFADYGATGYGLWKSDGTTAGTILVMNIWTGFSGAPLYQPANLTVVGSTLFFSGDGGFGIGIRAGDAVLDAFVVGIRVRGDT